jgi:Polysaccharide deacetylase
VHSVKPLRILHGDPGLNKSEFEATDARRPNLKKKLVSAGLKTLRSCGAFSAAGNSSSRTNRLLILCYHGISLQDEHLCWPHLYITPEVFRRRLQCLRRAGATVLPLQEALHRLRSGSLPPRSVAITFDDGFCDFLEQAVPILSDFGYPSTLYLTTHYCDYRLPIIGLVLDYILWKSRRPSIHIPELGITGHMPLHTPGERGSVAKQLLDWTTRSGMNTLRKSEIAEHVAHHLAVDYHTILKHRILQILSPDEIHEVMKAGVDIQLHTHRHRTPRNQSLFLSEIEENRRRIIDLTGKNPVHFCYPSGEYSPEFFGWLAGCGVQSATTCDAGLATRKSPFMKLPRVLDHSGMSMLRFESVLSGLFI